MDLPARNAARFTYFDDLVDSSIDSKRVFATLPPESVRLGVKENIFDLSTQLNIMASIALGKKLHTRLPVLASLATYSAQI